MINNTFQTQSTTKFTPQLINYKDDKSEYIDHLFPYFDGVNFYISNKFRFEFAIKWQTLKIQQQICPW